MARINFPQTFAAQQKMHTDINTKHVADGNASDLKPYFTQQGINMTADVAAGAQAAVYEKARGLHSRSAENYRELRDNHFYAPVFTLLKGMVQFLKGFYRDNERELGNWGVTVDNKSKIIYPADFDGQVALYKAFVQKHTSLGANSPLTPYLTKQNIVLATLNTEMSAAVSSHAAMKSASTSAEDARRERDNLWNPVVKHMRGLVDYLKKLNNDNPKALGAYGIVVDDAPRAPKLRTTTLIQGGKITIRNATIGGTLTNTGPGDLHLYRGKTPTGPPVIVPAGGQQSIEKGWSSITVVNPSHATPVKFTLLCNESH